MGAKSRRKGKGGELELVALAKECGFPGARRGAPMQAADAESLPDVDGVPTLWAEAKRYRRTPVSRFLEALLAVERPGSTSALFWRDDGGVWRVALDAREFLHRHRELLDLRAEVRALREPAPTSAWEEGWRAVAERPPLSGGQDSEGAA